MNNAKIRLKESGIAARAGKREPNLRWVSLRVHFGALIYLEAEVKFWEKNFI